MAIKWKLPGLSEPGFLRRKMELTAILDAEPTPDNLEDLVDFLTPYVEAEDPREALLEVSRVEYSHAILELLGYGNSVTPPKGGSSEQQ
jgi:hypothetical protein